VAEQHTVHTEQTPVGDYIWRCRCGANGGVFADQALARQSGDAHRVASDEPMHPYESRLPSGEWRCIRNHRTDPCGDCSGCREVQAINRAASSAQ
jgi:hypothetical protein